MRTLSRWKPAASSAKCSICAIVKTGVQIDLIVSEAVKTSQIEGESYDREDVRSSIRNQLGLNVPPAAVRDPRANGVAALMISVRDHFAAPLTEERFARGRS